MILGSSQGVLQNSCNLYSAPKKDTFVFGNYLIFKKNEIKLHLDLSNYQ